jgi:hypothetical protein
VLGWAIIERRMPNGKAYLRPEAIYEDGSIDIQADEQVRGVLPAIPGTVQVMGAMTTNRMSAGETVPDGTEYSHLGFAIPGADEPDWEEERLMRAQTARDRPR